MIFPIAYLPPTAWFATASRAVGALAIEAHEHYQKRSIRNRCRIAGPNGLQTLSIPLRQGKNNRQNIREVRIAYDEPWQRNHWRSIEAAYGSAPFFEHYAPILAPFYTRQTAFLFDYNLALIDTLLRAFKLPLQFELTTCYQGAEYQFEYDVQPYPQVFEDRYGFRAGLSSIDLLMCCGPGAFR